MVEHNRLWVPVFGSFVVCRGTYQCRKNTRFRKEDRWYKPATPAQACKVKPKRNSRAKQRCVFTEMDTHLVGTVGKLPDAAVN